MVQHTKNLELRLTKTYLLNQRMKHLEFEILNNIDFYYKPGQFISLYLKKNDKLITRNFSIANAPNPNGTHKIEIAVTLIPNGIATPILWNMQIGDHIKASGPYGIFILQQPELIAAKPKRYILVATGTGVTPYRAMLKCFKEHLTQTKYHTEIILLLGVRNNAELLYKEDFINFALEQPNFKFIACYSREKSNVTNNEHSINNITSTNQLTLHSTTYPTLEEYYGYVQDKLAELKLNPDVDLVYLCGNPNMVDQAINILETLGITKSKIRREKYISSK